VWAVSAASLAPRAQALVLVQGPGRSLPPSDITPDDFWAIHDLLLTGYTAPFLGEGPGKEEARWGAAALADLLPRLHPHGPCRAGIAGALEALGTGGAPRARVVAAAGASWACLPGNFTEASFDTPYTEEAIDNITMAQEARMPALKQKVGACEGSGWPRTCSYWSSMHAMAHRADMLGLGGQFLAAVVPVLASGATLCAGCTLHLRALHAPILSEAVRGGLGDLF